MILCHCIIHENLWCQLGLVSRFITSIFPIWTCTQIYFKLNVSDKPIRKPPEKMENFRKERHMERKFAKISENFGIYTTKASPLFQKFRKMLVYSSSEISGIHTRIFHRMESALNFRTTLFTMLIIEDCTYYKFYRSIYSLRCRVHVDK